MFLRTIGLPDADARDHLRGSGWISKYIFSGGILPAVIEIRESLRREGTLLVMNANREIGLHYVRTLNEWRRRLWMREAEVRVQRFDDRFIRTWDFYLAVCSGAFQSQVVRHVQLVLERHPCGHVAKKVAV